MPLVTVARFVDPPSAHLARGLLEANGIDAFVFNEHYVGMDWLHSQAVGGVELRVHAETLAQARALLDDPPRVREVPSPVEPDRSPSDPRERCPRCEARAVRPDRLDHRLRALSLGLGVPLASGRDRMRCEACGHRWRSPLAHRGVRRRVLDGAALALAALRAIVLFVLTLPRRIVYALTGRRSSRPHECWACGTPVLRGEAQCEACGVIHPPRLAFDRIIVPGRAYDAACPNCHTPWLRADYTGPSSAWTCAVCKGPLG